MSDLIREAIRTELQRDPLDEAEKLTGTSYKESKATKALGFMMHLNHVQDKQALLELSGDTTFSNKVDRYLEIATSLGFEAILKEPFVGKSLYKEEKDQNEHIYVLFERKRGILLCFDTYYENGVNGSNFYFNWKSNDPQKRWTNLPVSGGFKDDKDGILVGHMDAREALRFHITELENRGTFIVPWKHAHTSLHITGYQDWKDNEAECGKNHDYKQAYRVVNERITARFNKLPQYVRDAVKITVK